MWRKCVVLSLVCALASACSFAFVKGPPSEPAVPAAPIECTSSYVVPVVDYVIAASSFTAAFWLSPRLLGLESPDRGINWAGLKAAGVAMAVALPWYVGGEVGRRRVGNCRRTRAAL